MKVFFEYCILIENNLIKGVCEDTMDLKFNSAGLLEPGIHTIKWDEFYDMYSFSDKRRALLIGLKKALHNLKQAGCPCVYIDGSFVTKKIEPNDFDACWHFHNGMDWSKLDPVFGIFDNGRLAQKVKFGGEFFPHSLPENGSGLTFLQFFQKDRNTGSPKGIVRIELGNLQ